MKFDIRMAFINQGKQEAKNNKMKDNSIVEEIFKLCKKKKEDLTDGELQKLDLLQIELYNIYEDKARGAFIDPDLNSQKKGEKIQNIFFGPEKRNSDFASISKLMIYNKLVDHSSVISKYVAQFFSNLYSSTSTTSNIDVFLNSLASDTKKIDQNFQNVCDKEIDIEELRECINLLKNNKSPGNDRLTVAFYKTFSEELSPFLLLVFIEAIQKDELPVSLKQGVITLIPKPNKDKLYIENWRPISFLNNDSKLFAMIFARK